MTIKNILLALLMVVLFATGFMMGRLTAPLGISVVTPPPSTVTDTKDTKTTTDTAAGVTIEDTVAVDEVPQMTDAQKQMLRSFGLDPEKITITASMVACAEAKVGAARVEEIKNGATPSILEGAALLGCYSK